MTQRQSIERSLIRLQAEWTALEIAGRDDEADELRAQGRTLLDRLATM
jgi:hypothetical protein